jgi:hypothetical protein
MQMMTLAYILVAWCALNLAAAFWFFLGFWLGVLPLGPYQRKRFGRGRLLKRHYPDFGEAGIE